MNCGKVITNPQLSLRLTKKSSTTNINIKMQSLINIKCNSNELRGFVTGLILGDGSIDKGVHKRSFEMKSIHKDFVTYVKTILDDITPFNSYIKENNAYIKDGVSHKKYYRLRVTAHPYFNKLYHYFYNDYRHRKIYAKTLNWLTPRGLANWYMSDGYICLVGKKSNNIYNRRIDICTDRYYIEDVKLMIQMLKSKFDLDCGLVTRDRFHRIRIKSNSYEKFINLIKPYIVPSMLYKLYLGYNNKPNNLSDEAWEYQKYLLSAIAQTDKAVGNEIV